MPSPISLYKILAQNCDTVEMKIFLKMPKNDQLSQKSYVSIIFSFPPISKFKRKFAYFHMIAHFL